MRSAGFLFLGVFVGAVGYLLGKRVVEVVHNGNPERVLKDLTRQIEALDRRYGTAKS